MKRFSPIVLILIFLLSACTPASSPTASPTPEGVTIQPVQVEDADKKTQTESAFLPPATATMMATPEPTPVPVRFDLAGYRQFAIIKDYFPGLTDYLDDRSYFNFTTTLSPSGDQFAISGCFGNMTSTWKCETSKSGFLIILDSNSGNLMNEIPLGEAWSGSVDFTSDGKSLLYATNEYKIALWNLVTNKPGLILFTGQAPDSNYYPDVAAAPDGRSLAAVVDDKLYVWDLAGKILFQAPAYKLLISAGLEYSQNGSRLTVFSPVHTGVDIYETDNWTLVRSIPLDSIRSIAISPDGQFVAATNSKDDLVTIWDVNSGDQVTHLDPGNEANSLHFNPAGDMLIITGMGNLDTQDSYSNFGTFFETQTWTQVDTLVSFTGDEGRIEFNQDGSRMAVLGYFGPAIWGLPDNKLMEGFEVVKQFQDALSSGDYATAASLFEVRDGEEEYLTEMGLDLTNLPASFEGLCKNQEIFCLSVHDLVMMGNDWDTMVYLVQLKDSNGDVFTSPKGAHIIYFYLYLNADGQPRVSYPPVD